MGIDGILVLAIIGGCLALLIFARISPDIVFVGALTLIFVFGIIPVEQALVGFSNQGMLTIAALYVVATGMKETGAIQIVINKLLGNPGELWRTQARIVSPVMVMSAF